MSEAAAAARRWEAPAIDGAPEPGLPTAGRLEALQREAYDEAYARGFDEGLAAGQAAAEERAAQLDALLGTLAHPLAELDETVEQELVALAMTVVRQLFRREIAREPEHVVGVVREALGLLPVASRDVRVHLHPDDAALVRECLAPTEGERAWAIVEDPLQARGGCKVTTEQSAVDATARARLDALIASIAGDARR